MTVVIKKVGNNVPANTLSDKINALVSGQVLKYFDKFYKFQNNNFYEMSVNNREAKLVNQHFNLDFLSNLESETYYETEVDWTDELTGSNHFLCICEDDNLHRISKYSNGKYIEFETGINFNNARPVDIKELYLMDESKLSKAINPVAKCETFNEKLAALSNGEFLYNSKIGYFKADKEGLHVFDDKTSTLRLLGSVWDMVFSDVFQAYDCSYELKTVEWHSLVNDTHPILCFVYNENFTHLRNICSYTPNYNKPFRDSNGLVWKNATPATLANLNLYAEPLLLA